MNNTHAANAARIKSRIDILFSRLARMDMGSDSDAYAVEESILSECHESLVKLMGAVESGEV